MTRIEGERPGQRQSSAAFDEIIAGQIDQYIQEKSEGLFSKARSLNAKDLLAFALKFDEPADKGEDKKLKDARKALNDRIDDPKTGLPEAQKKILHELADAIFDFKGDKFDKAIKKYGKNPKDVDFDVAMTLMVKWLKEYGADDVAFAVGKDRKSGDPAATFSMIIDGGKRGITFSTHKDVAPKVVTKKDGKVVIDPDVKPDQAMERLAKQIANH